MGTDTKKIIKQREKLTVAYGVLEFHRQLLVQMMSDQTEFQIDILWQPGDGFVALDIESGSTLAPLDECINIIQEKGVLTREDFDHISI